MSDPVTPRRFRIDPGLGDVLDAMLGQQLDSRVESMRVELKAREISESTRRVFVAFGWLLSAASADPRLVEITAPEPPAPKPLTALANPAKPATQPR